MIRTAPLLLLSLCVAPALAQKPLVVDASVTKVDPADRSTRPPVNPISEQAPLSKTAPAGVTAPAGCTDAWFGTFTLNGKKVAMVVGKSKADADKADTAWVDLNGDGKLGADEKVALELTERQARAQGGRTPPAALVGKPLDVTLAMGGNKLEAKLACMFQGERGSASLSFPTIMQAKADIGGEERIVAVLDKDLDGKFGTAGDLWALAKAGDNPMNAYGMTGFGEHRFESGKQVGIEVKDGKIHVTATDASGPDPKDLAAQRHRAEKIWSDRFDAERADFVKAQQMDEARPRATTAIEWKYVTFDEGLALAKKENKPLFVDVMAFWCVWCYRMDYYTYVDKEVAEMMSSKFIPVKIIQEQDPAGDYKKLMEAMGARGIPAMAIFDGEGTVKHKISGWSKPEKFLDELKKGL